MTEETHMVQGLHNPPQYGYKPLTGTLFPSEYPFDHGEAQQAGYFWLKYFISQNSFFAIPKRPLYANYETLTNALNMNVIDFSHADIVELKNDQMSEQELEKLLELQHQYSFDRFTLRKNQWDNLEGLEQSILDK